MPKRRVTLEGYLRTVIDAVPDVVFAQDGDGRIRMANRSTATILGRSVEEIVGQKHSDLTPRTDDVVELERQIHAVLDTGEPNSVERCVSHPVTGDDCWFLTRVFPLVPHHGRDTEALVVATDISELKRAEDAARRAQQELLTRLAEAAEFRDEDTGQHTRRVGRLAAEIARLIGLSPPQVKLIEQAAPLHDVGKIGIPDAILLKPGPLTREEFEIVKTHTLIGAKLLSGRLSDVMGLAEQVALMHHERWDGSGYPSGLREDETPALVRVVWVADVVDALGHARAYRPAWPLDLIIAELRKQRGRKLGPECVDACLELLSAKDAREQWVEGAAEVGVRDIASARRRRRPGDERVRRAGQLV